jgi:hypothetical protein
METTAPTVTLAGVQYPVPDLVVEQLRVVFPALMRWQAALQKPAEFKDSNYDDLLLAVYSGAVQRNDPKLAYAAFRKMTIPHHELMAALEEVQKQTHLFKPKAEGGPEGEASPTQK